MEALASMKVPDDGNPIPMPETADAIELPAATFLWLTARNAEFLSGRSVFPELVSLLVTHASAAMWRRRGTSTRFWLRRQRLSKTTFWLRSLQGQRSLCNVMEAYCRGS